MSIMFRNSNAALEKELAAEDYRAHPVRNRIAVFAVALTAILIVVTFTVGIGFVNAEVRAMGVSPGSGADSAMIYGDEQVLERVRSLPQVEWAAFAKRCSTSYLHNADFSGLDVRLFAADEVHYDKNMVELMGVANMVNTVTTDVMARKAEYAAMQSIGMTGRQMKRDIFAKYAGLTAVSLITAAAVGAVLSYMIGTDAIFNFSIGAFGQALGIFLFLSLGLCMAMAELLTRVMNKKSVVERLRETT